MSDEENIGVEEESSQALAEAAETEDSQETEESRSQEAERRKRNDAEYNWAEMRRQMKEKDYQIEELKKEFAKIAQKAASPSEEEELSKLAEDDLLTVAQAKRLAQSIARKAAEEVSKSREAATVDERVQLKYPDFNDVVTKENIELLKQKEPELAQSLYHMPDPYNQAVAAYKLLKKMGASPPQDSYEKKKALENSKKPISVQAAPKQSAIGQAHLFENGLTNELKSQLWKEMQDAMKRG
ncbi:hypothetical protein HC928_02745 [bacterium]|nr:hypothetical protein [bacterium]